MAPEHVGVRPSVHPNRVEGIVVLVQSKDGSWCVTATFDRGGDPASRARHRLQWCAGLLWSKAATETCTREFGAGAAVATRHPVRPPAAQEAGGGQPRILETRDWILTEGWDRVSASPEHNAGAARHRLWVNYWFCVSWSSTSVVIHLQQRRQKLVFIFTPSRGVQYHPPGLGPCWIP